MGLAAKGAGRRVTLVPNSDPPYKRRMEIEFDPDKDVINRAKHGL